MEKIMRTLAGTTPGRLNGKVAVITAGTEGIGFATAQLFVNEGAYVFITGRRQKELNEAVKVIDRNVHGVHPDAGHGSQCQYPELFVRHVSMFLSAADARTPFKP